MQEINRKPRGMRLVIFVVIGLFLSVISTNGFEIAIDYCYGNASLLAATHSSLTYSFAQPALALFLILPYMTISAIAYQLSKHLSYSWAIVVFFVSIVLLQYIYFMGYLSSYYALQMERWTSASLSVGLLPLKSIPLIVTLSVVTAAAMHFSKSKSKKGKKEPGSE